MTDQPTFTKSNLRGSFVFLTIIVFVFVLPDLLVYFSPPAKLSITNIDHKEKKAFGDVKKHARRSYSFRDSDSKYSTPASKFNPDTYTREEWMALGLSEKQANVILKFRIRSNEDLKKIFVISEEFYELIKDSTVYEATPPAPNKTWVKNGDRMIVRVDVNSANEDELMKVPGIGPFYAKNIVKKRLELGGFIDLDQLLEVWKVDAAKLEAWKPYLFLSSDKVKRLNLNTATDKELAAHPYISWNLANSLVKLRLQKGSYKKVEDAMKSDLMTKELLEKLKPYLVVE